MQNACLIRWFNTRLPVAGLLLLMTACSNDSSQPIADSDAGQQDVSGAVTESPTDQDDRQTALREKMVTGQIASRDITNQRVLGVMRRVPRHEFVPPPMRPFAYEDSPLLIGEDQTISQPYIVALMTQLADPQPGDKVLDIGTGSGYQAAVLAELVEQVYSVEIVESLANEARQRLEKLGYQNIQVRHGDGYRGWPAHAPFDLIIVAAAPDHIPPALVEQLAPGGKLVIPVGDRWQHLVLVEKAEDGSVSEKKVHPVTFVPMTGEAEKQEQANSGG